MPSQISTQRVSRCLSAKRYWQEKHGKDGTKNLICDQKAYHRNWISILEWTFSLGSDCAKNCKLVDGYARHQDSPSLWNTRGHGARQLKVAGPRANTENIYWRSWGEQQLDDDNFITFKWNFNIFPNSGDLLVDSYPGPRSSQIQSYIILHHITSTHFLYNVPWCSDSVPHTRTPNVQGAAIPTWDAHQ